MPETPENLPEPETFLLTAKQAAIVEQYACPKGFIKETVVVGKDKDGNVLVETRCVPAIA